MSKELLKGIDGKLLDVLEPLLNNYQFTKSELDKLRKLPMFEESTKTKGLVRPTDAYKMYRETSATFLAYSKQISDLIGLSGSENEAEISVIAKYFQENIGLDND